MMSLARASLALLLSLGARSSVLAQPIADNESCFITRFESPECYESYLAANPERILRALPGIYVALVEIDSEYSEEELDADPCVKTCYQGEYHITSTAQHSTKRKASRTYECSCCDIRVLEY